MAVNKLMREGHGWSGNERNCCFLNVGPSRFADVAAVTALDLPDDGRALAVTDWDGDGKLDLWISCRTSPRLRLLRNNVHGDAKFLSVKLRGTRGNRDAIGARLQLHYGADGQKTLVRTLRAGEGFLSQSSKWIHFGLGNETVVTGLEVLWPDGERQVVEGLKANGRYAIEQGQTAMVKANSTARRVSLPSGPLNGVPDVQQARVVLAAPLPLPRLEYANQLGTRTSLPNTQQRARLINLWASWCRPCIQELQELHENQEELRGAGIEILSLNIEQMGKPSNQQAPTRADRHPSGVVSVPRNLATEQLLGTLEAVQRGLLDQQRPLALPTSFLVDADNHLRVIYKGPVTTEQLLSDMKMIGADEEALRDAAVPFRGRWYNKPSRPDPTMIAMRLIEAGASAQAIDYLRQWRRSWETAANDRPDTISVQLFLARLLAERQELAAAEAAFNEVLSLDANHIPALVGLSHTLLRRNQTETAVAHLMRVLELDPNSGEAMAYLAMSRQRQGRAADAVHWYQAALQVRPSWVEVINNLAWLLATDSDPNVRNADEAIRWAQSACQATGYQNAGMLDTLAAAYAEGGRFTEAVQTIQDAIQLAADAGHAGLVTQMHNRLKQYQSRQPFRAKPHAD